LLPTRSCIAGLLAFLALEPLVVVDVDHDRVAEDVFGFASHPGAGIVGRHAA
jgi:hypothetical protein